LNTTLASVTVAMLLPVLEIGPAPPIASSQIITSYCAEPVAVEERNISYATSATTELPLYVHFQTVLMVEMAESFLIVDCTSTAFANDLTDEDLFFM
jgi:hypothetical protein